MIQKAFLYMLMVVFLALPVSFVVNKVRAEKDLRPEHVLQEAVLIGSMDKGKVNTYRVVDTELQVACYVTVGELHGKTVAQDCFPLNTLGTMWVFEGGE
jgi:adenosylcobinamide amidohydrolase